MSRVQYSINTSHTYHTSHTLAFTLSSHPRRAPGYARAPGCARGLVGRPPIAPHARFPPSASLSPSSTPSAPGRLVPRHYPPLSRPPGHAPRALFSNPLTAAGGARGAALRALRRPPECRRAALLPPLRRCPLVVPLPPVPPRRGVTPRAWAPRPQPRWLSGVPPPRQNRSRLSYSILLNKPRILKIEPPLSITGVEITTDPPKRLHRTPDHRHIHHLFMRENKNRRFVGRVPLFVPRPSRALPCGV